MIVLSLQRKIIISIKKIKVNLFLNLIKFMVCEVLFNWNINKSINIKIMFGPKVLKFNSFPCIIIIQ